MNLMKQAGFTKYPRLGKAPYVHDHRTLIFSNYTVPQTAPQEADWTTKVSKFGMMLNDEIGDCGIAGPGHMIQMWTSNSATEVIIDDDVIEQVYSAVSGYNPNIPSSDRGVNLLDVLKYWKATGIGGHQIGGYALVDCRNMLLMKYAIATFGGLLMGYGLPDSAQSQDVWDVPQGGPVGQGEKYSWGGHCTAKAKYTAPAINNTGDVTWGFVKNMTWPFVTVYGDEAWAIFSQDFIAGNGESPSGFNRDQLLADLNQLH
jgi:hypothetical protein